MADEKKYTTKIKLSDNSVYYLKDDGALRASGGTMTGDLEVDTKIKTEQLYIMSIQTTSSPVNNVLTQNSVTGAIEKRSADDILEDIGGSSFKMDKTNGILSIKLGKFLN